MPEVLINGSWVFARPENYKIKNLSFIQRIKITWAVFTGKAETFLWPMGQ